MGFPKVCAVVGGCGNILTKTKFYEHKASQCCRQMENNQDPMECGFEDQANQQQHSWILKTLFLGLLKWQSIARISDRAMMQLILFMRAFLTLVADSLGYQILRVIALSIPKTIETIRTKLNMERNDFLQYVACPKCHCLYKLDDVNAGVITKCIHVPWPNHTQRKYRHRCNKNLIDHQTQLPKRVYAYKSISSYLKNFVLRPHFITSCNQWRQREVSNEYLSDIYDGQLWKTRHHEYLAESSFNLLGLINVDWFQPYKHTQYSLGAIYMVTLNLPREQRYKEENVMCIGLIPGPHEPSLHMNTYMEPIVRDLLILGHKGVIIQDGSRYGNCYKYRLLGLSCDLPATRKLGGFLSFAACQGCSKCTKRFPRSESGVAADRLRADYSGFHMQNWSSRCPVIHRRDAYKGKGAHTMSGRRAIETDSGARYSVLLELKYFNPITDHAIDPMHLLYLGIAKKMTKHYYKSGLLSKAAIATIQNITNNIRVPQNVGRLPRKIATGFSSFTADQWKNWTLIYSSIALKNHLPAADYKIWLLFVRVVYLLTRKHLKKDNVLTAHNFLIKFLQQVEARYGKEFCTPNMHMACHLKECIQDFSSIYSFWCFSFERYNGILADYNLNHGEICSQVMRHFLGNQQLFYQEWPEESRALENVAYTQRGTLASIGIDISAQIKYASSQDLTTLDFRIGSSDDILFSLSDNYYPEEPVYLAVLNMLRHIQPQDVTLKRRFGRVSQVTYKGEIFRANRNDKVSSNVIQAIWLSDRHPIQIDARTQLSRAGVIKSIFITEILSDSGTEEFMLLEVEWYRLHDEMYAFGHHLRMHHPTFEPGCSASSFIPIQRVLSKCGITKVKHRNLNAVVVIPLHGQWGIC